MSDQATVGMDAALKEKWVEALRSGEYQQVVNVIGDVSSKELCCLGVGAVVAVPDTELADTAEATKILARYGLEGHRDFGSFGEPVATLIALNDSGASFAQIADYIEQHIPVRR